MLDLIVVLANVGVSVLTYHFFTHNVTASVIGFVVGVSVWFYFRATGAL